MSAFLVGCAIGFWFGWVVCGLFFIVGGGE